MVAIHRMKFGLFFDKEVIDNISKFSNVYVTQNNRHDFQLTNRELKRFINLLLFSDYHTMPETDMLWSTDEHKDEDIIRERMGRSGFRKIEQNLH